VLLESVVNVSEGRDETVLQALAAAAAPVLLDLHRDPDHHRAVLTLAGPTDAVTAAVRALATAVVTTLDLTAHAGAHPRLGALDVVPFTPYDPGRPPPTDLAPVVPVRDEFARWLGDALGVPAFLYGPLPGGRTRTLPDIRRHAFTDFAPDAGPAHPHPTAGATAVGARSVLVAYNVWVTAADVARRVAPLVRCTHVRALGLDLRGGAQVSCNLVAPMQVGPAEVYDAVSTAVRAAGGDVLGAELVGLIPSAVLERIPAQRWTELGLSAAATVEARLGL